MRACLLASQLLLFWPASAAAEWQIKPFLGVTFGGDTTFVNLEQAAGEAHRIYGVSGMLLGEIFGVEGEFGYSPGFFGQEDLVLSSSITTVTGNFVVALPQKWTQYTLRPYVLAGGGAIRLFNDDVQAVFQLKDWQPAWDAGAGVTGFLTDKVGVSWELRYFRNISNERSGISFGTQKLSFWQLTMAAAIRLDRRTR
jgi:hypothetical protein